MSNRPEAASDVIFGTLMRQHIVDKAVEFDEPRLDRSSEIPLHNRRRWHCRRLLRDQVKSHPTAVAEGAVVLDAHVKVGDSRSSSS